MRRHRPLSVVASLALALLAGCGATPSGASGGIGHGASPACPPVPTLAAPPRRVVTMDGGAAAVLERLGVGDRIVGTAAPDFIRAFAGPERAALERIPVLDRRQGNAELVIAARPDLVVPAGPRAAASGARHFRVDRTVVTDPATGRPRVLLRELDDTA